MNTNLIESLRQAAPYIDAYRKKKIVLLMPLAKNLDPLHFNSIINDVVLLKKLGIELILIINIETITALVSPVSQKQLEAYEQQVSEYQKKIEISLTTLQCKTFSAPIVASNFGIFNGKDTYKLAQLRLINLAQFNETHSSSTIITISPIALNKNSEKLFIHPHNLACEVATKLKAEKLIIYQSKLKSTPASYRLRDIEFNAKPLFKNHFLDKELQLFFEYQDLSAIKRTHFIEIDSNSLLLELFSVDGSGILINTDNYEQIRAALNEDYFLIKKLISASLKSQALVDRTNQFIKEKISQFFVIDRDGFIIGCAGLQTFGENLDLIEIYAVSIHKDYQGQGRASSMLKYLEKQAKNRGFKQVLVRTTRIKEWFIEKGFKPCSLSDLPQLIQKKYNHLRKSIILIKTLK